MNKVETAWLAGWLEGEGSFTAHTTQRGYTRLIIRAVSNDRETVDKARGIAGCGNVHGPYCYGENRQPHWHWAVTRRTEAHRLMQTLRPFMSSRRQRQIDQAVRIGGPK